MKRSFYHAESKSIKDIDFFRSFCELNEKLVETSFFYN